MITIYAEKPDVGKKIAAALDCITLGNGTKVSFERLKDFDKAVKAQQYKDGFLKIRYNNDDTYVTWGYGHLCELKSAKDYDDDYKNWRNLPVPFVPKPYEIKVKDEAKKQFHIVKSLFDKSRFIINATDFDREGEVIYYYLMQAARCSKPFKRAHFASQTKEGIIDAFNHLKSSDEIKNMTDAGRARSIADWVVGCNLTVAMSLKNNGSGILSIGRVQTPTLNMLVERELAIRNFTPETYYVVKALFKTTLGETYEAESLHKRMFDKTEAECVFNNVDGHAGKVVSIDKKSTYKEAPKLFNLSALQMAANSKYGLTLAETLAIAQELYEGGYTTYPRTDSQFLTEDMEPAVNNVLDMLASSVPDYAKLINGRPRKFDRAKYFDNSKVQSHYAIIPTTTKPSALTPTQQKVYDLIARSVIMMIYPQAKLERTTVVTEVNGEKFSSTGCIVVSPGWMEVDSRAEEKLLPNLKTGEIVSGKYSLQEKQTEAPKRYTDKSLVAGMIGAGKELDDAELRKVMAEGDKGIGTEATRAAIIETLIARGYAVRSGKSIAATEKGIALIACLPLKEIKSAELTAIWEKRLDNIASGKETMDVLIGDIEKAVAEWCRVISQSTAGTVVPSANDSGLTCPGCGNKIIKHSWGFGCSNYKNGCKFAINCTVAGKKLTERQMTTLISKGEIGPIKGFTSKSGKKFDAKLKLEYITGNELVTDCKVSFVFDSAPRPDANFSPPKNLRCPACGSSIHTTPYSWECEKKCGFSFRFVIAGRKMEEKDLKNLIQKGSTGKLDGFTSKSGKPFSCSINLKENKKETEFIFS